MALVASTFWKKAKAYYYSVMLTQMNMECSSQTAAHKIQSRENNWSELWPQTTSEESYQSKMENNWTILDEAINVLKDLLN